MHRNETNYCVEIDMNVAMLLSGGVDSSVALHLLKEQGITPHCFYIKIGRDEDPTMDCSSEEDIEMATAVARRYGCKLDVIDLHREYWDKVVSYIVEKVRNGLTPNPDVMCNRLIKLGAFHDKVGHRFDYIATGHYATIVQRGGHIYLGTARDLIKDQTDFLCQITYRQLTNLMLPIGNLMKSEVREIAERESLVNAHRKDSQGICFLGKLNYNDLLRNYLGEREGDIIDIETGNAMGKHKGYWFHTIGQRKGIGLSGGPWFVVKKDIKENTIYVSRGYDPATCYSSDFRIHGLNLLLPEHEEITGGEVTIKIRHTPEFTLAHLAKTDNTLYNVKTDKPLQGVAAGQFCTIYDRDHRLCYGSGEIV